MLPIIQYWHSTELPADIERLLATFRACNPNMRHLVFDEAGADSFIAEHLGGRELAAFRSCAVPAMQADFFRYCAVYVLGGICCDVDYRCVRPFTELIAGADHGLLFQKPNGAVDNGVFLFRSPGHRLLRLALNIATRNIERRAWEEVWWMTGPSIFTVLWELHRTGSPKAVLHGGVERGYGSEVELLLQTIGDHGGVAEAFAGVEIAPFKTVQQWIKAPRTPPQYKQSADHWINWQKAGVTIFR